VRNRTNYCCLGYNPTLSKPILTRIIGSVHSLQFWDQFDDQIINTR
jgi:hypothetical protein